MTGATLTVLDKNGNVVDTWTSDAREAHVIKRLVVGETYTLREEYAPYGYLKATDIQFTVKDTGEVQHVNMKDEVARGSIVVTKDGEIVSDATIRKEYWNNFVFNFLKRNLSGVTFDVYAKEDILSVDGLNTVYYKAGDKISTIVTDEQGIARIDNLPCGKYYLIETKTIDGFILDNTPIEADISYIDQNTNVVYAGMNVTNERQKVQISVIKTDSETKKVLEGAVFGLFTKEDIVNADGKVIVNADTQIEKAVTGKDGKVTFTSDLPLGQYYVKELEAPAGYVKSDKVIDVDATYKGDNVKVKKTAKITEESIEETRLEESSSAARTTSQAVSSTAATSPVKKTESVKSFSYDKNSKAFTFELNGNTFKYPVAAASIKDLGYIYVSNTLSSETATLDMYMDAYKSTIMIKYNTKAGNTSDCYAIAVELKEGSTFMGLSTTATYATVKDAFKNADTEVSTDYRSDTATGILQYMYGDRRISVTLDSGYVTGALIE